MWLTRITAPLLYGAALLLVSVAAPAAGVTPRQLSGLNLALTALYLVWLFLAVLPRLKRRWFGERRSGGVAPTDIEHPRADLGDGAVSSPPGRSRVRVQRVTRKAVKDA